MRVSIAVILFGAFLVAGCAPAAPGDRTLRHVIEIPDAGVSIPYWEQRVALGDANGAEYVYSLSSSREAIQPEDPEVHGVQYDKPSEGLGDWIIPRSIRDALASDRSAPSCDLMAADEVYVPMNMRRPNHCEAFVTADGLPGIAVVGFGQPFEGPDFPQSMIVVFAEERAVVVSQLTPFPETEARIEELADEVGRSYPNLEYMSEGYGVLLPRISALLEEAVTRDASEFTENAKLLAEIGRGMRVR